MTTKEKIEIIGQVGSINQGGLDININIHDVKESYGNVLFEVSPVSGGIDTVWVRQERVRFTKSFKRS